MLLLFNNIKYDENCLYWKKCPWSKEIVIDKNNIKQLMCWNNSGKYGFIINVFINLNGKIDTKNIWPVRYDTICKKQGMKNIYYFAIFSSKDLIQLFESHPHLLKDGTNDSFNAH